MYIFDAIVYIGKYVGYIIPKNQSKVFVFHKQPPELKQIIQTEQWVIL